MDGRARSIFRVDDHGGAQKFMGRNPFDKEYHAAVRFDGFHKRYSRRAFKRASEAQAYCERWVARVNRMAKFIHQSSPMPVN